MLGRLERGERLEDIYEITVFLGRWEKVIMVFFEEGKCWCLRKIVGLG